MRRNILFVEDDPDDVEMTLLGLEAAGFKPGVSAARDGVEALAALEKAFEAGELPGAVVTDLKMPRLGGLELMRRLRADPRFRAVPLAVLTSSDDPSDRRTASELGALFLTKPLELAGFEAIARRIEALALSEA